MLPLGYAETGKETVIRRITGTPEVRRHLADLGFVAGAVVTVLTETAGNYIVRVKDARVAISREAAQRIFV